MSIAIRYYTKGGNTEKLAKAIEEVLGTEAKRYLKILPKM